jgi:primase-polymerase (primpol)-like protein
MKINFYNYDIIGRTMRLQHPIIMKFIEEQDTDDFEQINVLIKEKFNSYDTKFGTITIDTKTIALLNLNKEETKSLFLIQENNNNIYNKDFKRIITRLNTYNKKNPNTDLHMLKIFFELSIRAKSKYISLYLQSKEL